MTASPDLEPGSWGELASFTAGLAVARARRGLLTGKEIRDALDEAYRQGQAAAAGGDGPAAAVVALSQWINAGNVHRDPESVLWSRVLKVAEEAGEVYSALSGAIGENPRKGVTHSMDDVAEELLDVAVAALAAVEHLRDHDGHALALLNSKILRVHARALSGAAPTPEATDR